MLRIGKSALTLLAIGAAACTKEGAGFDPLPVSATVALAPAEFVVYSGAQAAGAVAFPEAGAAGAEYLVVGQFATGLADLSTNTRLGGQAAFSSSLNAPSEFEVLRAPANDRDRFHAAMLQRSSTMAREAWRFRAEVAAAPRVRTPPPPLGDVRTFKVCGDLSCDVLNDVPATAQFVGQHAAIYVDNGAPASGLSGADLAAMGAQFDTVLYDIAVDAFGSESDLDGNGVVIVLLSQRINALISRPQCEEAFISGFFYAGDLAPGFAAQHNNGEVFYGLVPDPAGTVSCPRTVNEVRNILPVTFVHEFQHMISFNQRVLVRPGLDEVLWLNEGLSHLAEELVGLYYDSIGDDPRASRFLIGNLYNGFVYLRASARNPMVTVEPPGSLESRGAAWLFLRYLTDRFGAGVSRSLVQTSSLGAANIEAATGRAFGLLLAEWALAMWVDDLPSFTPPATLRYSTWNFRTTFGSLNSQAPADFNLPFPIVPAVGTGGDAVVSGPLTSGSSQYLTVTQPASGAAFALTLRPAAGGSLPANRGAQLAIIRLR